MSTWQYSGILAVFILGVMGVAYSESEVRTVLVADKFVEDVQGRRGTSTRYVLRTHEGDLPILSFPLIGYTYGTDEVYSAVVPGSSIQVRVAQWPPRLLGNGGRPHILAVY